MFTKHATLALAAIGTQAIRLSTVAHVDAEAEAEYRYAKTGLGMPWPWGPGLAQTDAETKDDFMDWMAQVDAEADAEIIWCFYMQDEDPEC